MPLKDKFKSYAIILLAVSIWGAFPSILKLTLYDLNIISVITIRFAFSSLLLLYLVPRILKKRKIIPLKSWLKFFAVIGIMFFFQAQAIKDIPVSWYVIIFSTCPILMAILLRYKFTYIAILGIVIVIIGMYKFVSADVYNQQSIHFLQIIILLIGMLSWVFYSMLIKQFHFAYSDLEIAALTCYIGAIIYIAMFLVTGSIHLSNWNTGSILLAIGIGIMLMLAFIFYSYGMRKEPVFSIFSQYLEPIFGLIASFSILNDKITWQQIIYSILIILGTILVMFYSKKS